MKHFDNIRAHKPEGIENRKAYIVGGGVAGLATAVFLIDDCYVPGENVTIYDQLPLMGGSMDGAKIGDGKYTCRGERGLEPYMECFWYLGNKIPSLYTPGRTITEETVDVNKADRIYCPFPHPVPAGQGLGRHQGFQHEPGASKEASGNDYHARGADGRSDHRGILRQYIPRTPNLKSTPSGSASTPCWPSRTITL